MKLKIFLPALLAAVCAPAASAQVNLTPDALAEKCGIAVETLPVDCDTIINIGGKSLHIVRAAGAISNVGLAVFPAALYSGNACDPQSLLFAEGALLDRAMSLRQPRYASVSYSNAGPDQIAAITPDTPLGMGNDNSRTITFRWTPEKYGPVAISFPASYQSIAGADRGATEQKFITGLEAVAAPRKADIADLDISQLQLFVPGVFVLPGDNHVLPDINRNLYLKPGSDNKAELLGKDDSLYLAEAMANLFVAGVTDVDPELQLNIMVHDYGKTQTVSTTIGKFLEYCLSQGCVPYFGTESLDGDRLSAAVFMHNAWQGYDHVLRLTATPEALAGNEPVVARPSLFGPSNNLGNIFEEDEGKRNKTMPSYKLNLKK